MAYDYLIWGIGAAVVVLVVLAMALMRRNPDVRQGAPDQAQTLGIALVVLGVVFGTDRLVGYSFIGCGVFLSIVSVAMRWRRGRA